jgi:hypothetical protein
LAKGGGSIPPPRTKPILKEGDMQKISIEFQETPQVPGKSFEVRMVGLGRNLATIPQNEWTGAEFWSNYMMNVTIQILQQAGIIQTVNDVPVSKLQEVPPAGSVLQ